jgi:hypothetical protein
MTPCGGSAYPELRIFASAVAAKPGRGVSAGMLPAIFALKLPLACSLANRHLRAHKPVLVSAVISAIALE